MKCIECGSNLVLDGGDLICQGCGVVYQGKEKLVSQDVRAGDYEEWQRKTSHESSKLLGSGDPKHIFVHGPGNGQTYKEKNNARLWRGTTVLCDRLHLPDTVKEESIRRLQATNFKGRSTDLITALTIFLFSKQQHVPRSLNTVLKAAGLENNVATHKQLKKLRRELHLPVVVNKPHEYLGQVIASLKELDDDVERASQMLDNTVLNGAVAIINDCETALNYNPVVVAASAILVALGLKHPYDYERIELLSQASGISKTALITRSKELRKK